MSKPMPRFGHDGPIGRFQTFDSDGARDSDEVQLWQARSFAKTWRHLFPESRPVRIYDAAARRFVK
jgi:hypothetical protein